MQDNSNHSNPQRDMLIYFSIICLTGLIIFIHHLHLKGIGIALIVSIAIFEASVLCYYFMHLETKRRAIHLLLLLTIIVFLGLIFWPAWDVGYSSRTPSEFTVN